MKITLFFLVFFYTAFSFGSQIEIPNTNISFMPPKEFKLFSKQIIEAKWPRSTRAPKWVVGSESTATSIAYGIRPIDISTVPLAQLMAQLKQSIYTTAPGAKFLKTEVTQINGKDWIYLEVTANTVNADIHNIMLATSYQKQMVLLNFNSVKDEFPLYEDALRASIQSISSGD